MHICNVWLQGRVVRDGILVVDDVVGVRNEDTAAFDAKMTPGNGVANVVFHTPGHTQRHGYGKLVKYAVGEYHEKGVVIRRGDRLFDTHSEAYVHSMDITTSSVVRVQLNSHIG